MKQNTDSNDVNIIECISTARTRIVLMGKKVQRSKKSYRLNELDSLGIESKRNDELNNIHKAAALADNNKQAYYQDYKSAYSDDRDTDESHFDYII